MNHETRIGRLQTFGYTRRQADFLVTAAVHSGYFLLRQFQSFSGTEKGGNDARLLSALKKCGHVRAIPFDLTHLFHLSSRPFYRAIGLEHSRHRRRRGLLSIKVKIMALDLVLARPGDYLADEPEKIRAFEVLGARREDLPVRVYHGRDRSETRRWFVDKFPLRFAQRSEPVFSFIDPGFESNQPFYRHLLLYERLLRAVPRFSLVYASDVKERIERARAAFERFTESGPDELQELARLEAIFARREIESLGQKGLIRLRNLREKYGSKGPISAPRSHQMRGRFLPLHLENDYSLFHPGFTRV